MEYLEAKNYFRNVATSFPHKHYLKNGGTITDRTRYLSILKAISVEIVNEILTKGSRIEIPFFGELFIEEKQVHHKTRNRKVKRNQYLYPSLVFKTYLQNNYYMKMYTLFDVNDKKLSFDYMKNGKIKSYYKKTLHSDTGIMFNVLASKRKNKVYYFKKLLKKKK
ncbi:MAG: hypothetical protein WAT79_08880 [Saprospiraceae bacterium]